MPVPRIGCPRLCAGQSSMSGDHFEWKPLIIPYAAGTGSLKSRVSPVSQPTGPARARRLGRPGVGGPWRGGSGPPQRETRAAGLVHTNFARAQRVCMARRQMQIAGNTATSRQSLQRAAISEARWHAEDYGACMNAIQAYKHADVDMQSSVQL